MAVDLHGTGAVGQAALPRRARAGVATVFGVTGVVFATWAARIPAIEQRLRLDDARLAAAFTALNAGAVAGLQLGGVLVPRLGGRAPLWLGVPAHTPAPLG